MNEKLMDVSRRYTEFLRRQAADQLRLVTADLLANNGYGEAQILEMLEPGFHPELGEAPECFQVFDRNTGQRMQGMWGRAQYGDGWTDGVGLVRSNGPYLHSGIEEMIRSAKSRRTDFDTKAYKTALKGRDPVILKCVIAPVEIIDPLKPWRGQ